MEGEPPLKRAKGSLKWLEEDEQALTGPQTHVYDLGDCLHDVAKHLPLNSCLRSRLVSKAFAAAFGWSVREIMQLVLDDSGVIVRDLQRCSQVYPAAESLLLVLDKYEDMPQLQVVTERLKLEGPSGYKQALERPSACASGSAAGPSNDVESVAGPGPSSAGAAGASAPAGRSSLAQYPRRSPRLVKGALAAATTGSEAAAAASMAAAVPAAGSPRGRRGAVAAAAADLALSRVTRLAIRCNISSSDVAKERQRYKDLHSRRPGAPLLQLLGIPPALLEMVQEQGHGPDGPAASAAREGHGVAGPTEGEELLDLGFLARMPALTCLRLAVPLDLRPRSSRIWVPGPSGAVGGLGAVAALRQLRRLDLLPMNGLTSADIAPLGGLSGSLQHLELYLDDAPTLHWHRRPEGYEAPEPSHMQMPGPFVFMTSRRMREYEYATRVHPAWTRLNSLLAHLPRLANLIITGTAPFWVPMGQFLLAEHPHILNLHLTCTTSPAEFTATPLLEQQEAGGQQQPGPRGQAPLAASGPAGVSGSGYRPATGQGGVSAAGWTGLGRVGPPDKTRRHWRVVMRHAEGHTLLEDARQLLPIQPLPPQDEVSVDICGMGTVQPDLGPQIRELVASMPVRSLVIVHCTWTDPRVATEVIGALLGSAPASSDGSAPLPQQGLRKLQLWSRDKEAFDVSSRALSCAECGGAVDPEGSASRYGSSSASTSGSPLSGTQELVIHGLLPDTLGSVLPASLKRLSLAHRIEGQQQEGGTQPRRLAALSVSCLPEGLEALDLHHMSLQGPVPGRGLPQLSNLSLHSCVMTDLDQLAPGPRLRKLVLFRNTILCSSMKRLADRCPGITELSLQEAFSPDGPHRRLQMSVACAGLLKDVEHISRLTRLETLSLPILHSSDAITAVVPHLVTLPSLHGLLVQGLWDARVPALGGLAALKRLEWLKLHMIVDPRYFNLKPPTATTAAAAGAAAPAALTGAGPGPSGQGQGTPGSQGVQRGRRRQRKGSPSRSPAMAPAEDGQPAKSRGRRAASSSAGSGAAGGPPTASRAAGNDPGSSQQADRRLTRSQAAALAATAAACPSQAPARVETGGRSLRSTWASERDRLASADASATTSGVRGPRTGGRSAAAAAAVAQTAAPKPPAASRAKRGRVSPRPTKRRRGNDSSKLPAAGAAADSSASESSGAEDSGVERVYDSEAEEAPRGHRSRRRAAGGGDSAPIPRVTSHEAASDRGAGPSGQAGGPVGDLSGEPPATPLDAHTVSRDLYDTLAQNLPHTRVAMKLITITFKSGEDRPGGGGGGGGGGPAPHGGENAGAGGGGGGAGGAGQAAGGGAGAAAPGGAQAAGGDVGGGGGGAGDGGGGGGGGPAGAQAGGNEDPAIGGDGAGMQAVDEALGDMGMLIFGFAMAAMGLPPPAELMLEPAPGPPGAGAAAAAGPGAGGAAGGGGAAAAAAGQQAQHGGGDAGHQHGGGGGGGNAQGGDPPGPPAGGVGCNIM